MADAHKIFSYGLVVTAPSPATSGTTLILQSGQGALFPTPPFNATAKPFGTLPIISNAEVVRVTNISGDTLTITRAQEGSTAMSIAVGWELAATITPKTLTDIENTALQIGGDLTGTITSPTIANNAVTNAKSAQMAANTIKGNNTGSTANATDLTTTQAKALLAITESDVSNLTTDLASKYSASNAPPDATSSYKGQIQLAGDLGGIGSSATAPILKNVAKVFNIKDYGAVGDGVTDDSSSVQSAVTAMGSTPGILHFPASSYYFGSTVNLISGITISSPGSTAVNITFNPVSDTHAAVFTLNNISDVTIEKIGFTINNKGTAIKSLGHDNLKIRYCSFTGTTTSFLGIIGLDGNAASASYTDTLIAGNKFYSVSDRVIFLYARAGHSISRTKITNNEFVSITSSTNGTTGAIDLTPYDTATINGTIIANNTFLDCCTPAIQAGVTNIPYAIHTLNIIGNYYNQTQISPPNNLQGFAFVYSCYGVVIDGNTILGTWSPTNNVADPAIAPGRQGVPVIGLTITNNYIQGFSNPWDPDSMRNVEVANNVVYRCGQSFGPGYGIQEYVDIHDNVHYNSAGSTFNCGLLFANASIQAQKVKVHDNLYIDDRPIPVPTGVTATLQSGGSLTASPTYYYVVTALDEIGETLKSSEVSATTDSTHKQIKISWTAVSGAKSYSVYRSTTSGTYTSPCLISSGSLAGIPYSVTDNGITALAGAPPTLATVESVQMQQPIEMFNFDFSDYEISNNRFYLPNSSFTTGLFYTPSGVVALPRTVYGNELHDSTGITIIGGVRTSRIVTKTANYTLDPTDSIILADTSSGGFTLTLPTAANIAGRQYIIKKIASANTLTIATTSSQRIDGSTTATVSVQYVSLTAVSDGNNWQII